MLPTVLFQFDRPVSVVEELLPALVSFVAEVDVDKRVAFWFDGRFDKRHSGLFRRPAAFSDVAVGAGAYDIVPARFAAKTSRDNVVE